MSPTCRTAPVVGSNLRIAVVRCFATRAARDQEPTTARGDRGVAQAIGAGGQPHSGTLPRAPCDRSCPAPVPRHSPRPHTLVPAIAATAASDVGVGRLATWVTSPARRIVGEDVAGRSELPRRRTRTRAQPRSVPCASCCAPGSSPPDRVPPRVEHAHSRGRAIGGVQTAEQNRPPGPKERPQPRPSAQRGAQRAGV